MCVCGSAMYVHLCTKYKCILICIGTYIMCRRTRIRAINNFWDFPEPRKTRPDQSPGRRSKQSGRENLYSVRFPKKEKKTEMKQNN